MITETKRVNKSSFSGRKKPVRIPVLETDNDLRDEDLGSIKRLEMNIQPSDNQSVQKNYLSIPRLLYTEIKAHIEDLLNRNIIPKSKSPYPRGVVRVGKKDKETRLCVDC